MNEPAVDSKLLEWARQPGPAKVLAAARQRLEAGHGLAGSPLRLPLTGAERDQVAKLLGTRWALSGRLVGMKGLSDAVATLGADLGTLLTAVGGPLGNRPLERAAARRVAEDERASAAAALTAAGVPGPSVAEWLARRGLPRAGSGQLLMLASRCAQVWMKLPGSSPAGSTVLLTVLAAEALDDPHALDRGSSVAAGVLRLLGFEVPDTAESWRAAWDEIGVACDPVSSRVLVLNLALDGDATACKLTAAAGPEPLWLTWRSLAGQFRCGAPDVYVCENPSVLIAAADQLGSQSLPLLCMNGRPSAAAQRLLNSLAVNGTTLHVRADADAAGRDIVSKLQTAIPGLLLWRYSLTPAEQLRYEEQDLEILLGDLRA
jgi:uncharacterized protein (TIGR02679 family)